MTAHAKAETLSAYLDERLVEEETRELEEHLARCDSCHSRLEGMRSVVSSLRRLERFSPPSTLDQMVARRIALSGKEKSFLDRLEEGMSGFQRQSSMLSIFCVVIALVLIVYFFLSAVVEQNNSTIPVVFESPPEAQEEAPEVAGQVLQLQGDEWVLMGEEGSRMQLSGKVLVRQGERWIEDGVDPETVTRSITWDSAAGGELLQEHSWIAPLADLKSAVVLRVDGEVVEIQ